MSQLLEFKTKPFEAIHFRQSARLVSADALTIEKQKTSARKVVSHKMPMQELAADMKYINKVNNTFSSRCGSGKRRKVSLTKPDSGPITAPGAFFSSCRHCQFCFGLFSCCRTTGNVYATTGNTGSPGGIRGCCLYSGH